MNTNTIVLLGQTGSGKSTLAKLLVERLGYNLILEYTTRPIRDGEVNHINYHYISDDEFIRMINDGDFVSYKYFDTIYGRWYYGSTIEDYKKGNGVIALNPGALKQLLEHGIDVTSVYIKLDDDVIIKRLGSRGDNIKEVQRRLDVDRPLFDEAPKYVDIILDGNKTPDELVNEVISKISKNKEDLENA